jgi:hypothetical protein
MKTNACCGKTLKGLMLGPQKEACKCLALAGGALLELADALMTVLRTRVHLYNTLMWMMRFL